MPERLVAEGDGVVVEPRLGVLVRRLLVVRNRLVDLSDAEVQVADPIVEAQLEIQVVGTRLLVEDPLVDLDGGLPVLLLLVLTSLVFEFGDRRHAFPIEPSSAPSLPGEM